TVVLGIADPVAVAVGALGLGIGDPLSDPCAQERSGGEAQSGARAVIRANRRPHGRAYSRADRSSILEARRGTR
ncbi:MAG: hypothetical protein O7B23_09505, partial [Deltaproteobacteria bacterium]|nr:hypothetical protein [Deltaproteobacteria bacterium]